jgi:hypothetical protein
MNGATLADAPEAAGIWPLDKKMAEYAKNPDGIRPV